jgi:hypothetical protein
MTTIPPLKSMMKKTRNANTLCGLKSVLAGEGTEDLDQGDQRRHTDDDVQPLHRLPIHPALLKWISHE